MLISIEFDLHPRTPFSPSDHGDPYLSRSNSEHINLRFNFLHLKELPVEKWKIKITGRVCL